MNALIRHIEYLMSRTDCVIIPGIGGLLARYEAATFDAENKMAYPPSRVFTFNGALTLTDGALACSLARAEGISYEDASERIAEMADALKRQLALQGECPLGRIGKLYIAHEGEAPQFEPYAIDVTSCATCFLPVVQAQAKAADKEVLAEMPAYRQVSTFGRFLRVAASIAVLIAVCFVASTPIPVNDAALASLSPEIRPVPAEELLPADEQPAPEATTLRICGSKAPVSEEIAVQPLDYLVIVASFATEAEAERYASQHSAANCGIIEKSGRYRVYSSAYATEGEAYRAIANDQSLGGSAWVCKR